MNSPGLLRHLPSAVLSGLVLFFSSSLYAATANHPGGLTGGLTSGSAEILPEQSVRYFGSLGYIDFYDAGSGNGEIEGVLETGVTFGVSPNMEAGIAVALANNLPTISTGTQFRYLRGQAKYRFYGSRAQGSAAALSVYATTAELTGVSTLASGNNNSGWELSYSELGLGGDTHYAMALEQRDYKSYSGGSFIYSDIPVLSLSASHLFRTDMGRNYELGLRAESATISSVPVNNVYLTAGAQFATGQPLSYLVGAMLDIYGAGGPNRSRYYFGVSYQSNDAHRLGKKRFRKEVQEPAAMAEKPPAVAKPETKKPAQAKAQKPLVMGCKAYVEILDLSGINGLAEQVAFKLKKDGYCIRSIYVEDNSHAYYSHLYYGLDKGELAIELAREYKVQGEVSRRRLPANVDIRFIVGKDQR